MYATQPHRARNRRLAMLVFVVGTIAFVVRPLRLLLTDAGSSYALSMTGLALLGILPLVYARFLVTLKTPWVAPLRTPLGQLGLWVYAAATTGLVLFWPEQVIKAMEPFSHLDTWAFTPGWANRIELVTTAFLFYSFGAAVSAARRAPPGTARQEARSIALAIGVHDVLLGLWLLFLAVDGVWNEPITDTTLLGNHLTFLVEPLASLLLAVLLGYGILRHQLLGIELTVKKGLKRSVVVGSLVLTFLVVSEGLEELVVSGPTGTLGGLFAAAVLAFALRPLERAAEHLTNRLMPGVADTPAYRASRRREVYRAAVESALVYEEATYQEKEVLATLQDHLGLSESEAKAVEQAVFRGRKVDPP